MKKVKVPKMKMPKAKAPAPKFPKMKKGGKKAKKMGMEMPYK